MKKDQKTVYPPMADPVIGWLCHKRKWNDWQVIGLLMMICAIIMLGLGSLASQQFTGIGRRISSVDNIAFILAWILIFIPLIWEIYLWQGRVVTQLFDHLNKERVFGKPENEQYREVNAAASKIITRLTHSWVYFLVIVLLSGFWIYEIGFGWPQQIMVNGPQYWMEVGWYFPLHMFSWTIGLYAVFTLAIRQIIIVFGISSVLGNFDVMVKAFDPDEAGGLGSLGNYIKTSILFVIGIGALATLFAIEVAIAGSSILERFDVLGLFLIYITLASLSLIVPTAQARKAMLRARQKALDPIAAQIQETLEKARSTISSKIETEDIKNLNLRLTELQTHYVLVLQSFPVTPMTIRSLRNFSISALLPLMSGIISIALQLFK
jgi:hypothetical protein